MPSSIPQVKAGLKQYLEATAGLRRTDGITIRSADPAPAEMVTQMVVLGQVTAPQTQAGLRTREETPTLTCHILVTKIGVGEAKAVEARDRAYELKGLLEGAIAADRSAASTVPPPGRLLVTNETLQEFPVDWDDSPARRAQIELSISWTSDVTT